MNLPMAHPSWRETAQKCRCEIARFSFGETLSSIKSKAGSLPKRSVCTSQYRYPSPTTWFGPVRAEPFFLTALVVNVFAHKTAKIQPVKLRDSHKLCSLLYVYLIITNKRGTKQCRSNTWPLWQYLLSRFQHVWTMTLNAPQPARLRAPLLRMLPMAACLRGPSSVRPAARFVTMSSCVNHHAKLTTTQNTPDEKSIAAQMLRWIFFVLRWPVVPENKIGRMRFGQLELFKNDAEKAQINMGKAC